MAKQNFSLADSINQALGKDVSNSDTMSIEYVDYAAIKTNDKNFYELSSLDSLAGSIATVGLQQPLVVTDTDDPEKVLLISGHRRHAAIGLLINDPEEPRPELQRVAVIRQAAADEDLLELKLLFGNSSNRELTSPELMQQSARVEEVLYRLKEKGYDFPGKMRSHVAQACQASESKLARLKVIREGLREHFMKAYQAGDLSEQAAYAIARMPDALQEMLENKRKSGKLNGYVAENILQHKDNYLASKHTCKNGDACTNCSSFLAKDASASGTWDMCHGSNCCWDCSNWKRDKCKYVCLTIAEKNKKAAAKDAAAREKQEEENRKVREQTKTIYRAHAQRIECIVDEAGKSIKDLSGILGSYSATQLERGLNPKNENDHLTGLSIDIDKLAQLCQALGISADYLLGLTDSNAAEDKGGWIPHRLGSPPAGALVVVEKNDGGFRVCRYCDGYCDPGQPELGPLNISAKKYVVLPEG